MAEPSSVAEAASLQEWREQITHQVLRLIAIAALPILVFALARPSVTWSAATAILYLLSYGLVLAALAARGLPQPVRGWLAVLPFFVLAIVSLLRTGWLGNARMLLVGATLLGFILVGSLSGWVAAAVSVALYLGFSVAAAAGLLDATFVAPAHPLSFGDWAYYGGLALLLMVPTLGYLTRYQRFQANLAGRWRSTALRLADEIARRRKVEDAFLDFTERERLRLGLELHDGLCQQIAGSRLICTSVERRLSAEGAPHAERLRSLGESLEDALDQAYELARGLGSDVSGDGLPDALQALARRTEDRFEVSCAFEHTPGPCNLGPDAATQLLRIAQEAVSNAIRHGHPSRIRIELISKTDGLVLCVTDDGGGFSSHATRGLGLDAMEHRAELVGGGLEIVSDPTGTRVRCHVPGWPDAAEMA